MKKVILIFGIPGSGKTYLASRMYSLLKEQSEVYWYNADEIRAQYNDWDFSLEGRMRQAMRMRDYTMSHSSGYILIDMVAPLSEYREVIGADILIWVDTISEGRYENTNRLFEKPERCDYHITEWDDSYLNIVRDIINGY